MGRSVSNCSLTSHWYLFSGSNIYFGENYKMQDFLALWWVNFRPKSKVIMGYHVFFGFSQAHCSPSVSRYKYLPQLQREKAGATQPHVISSFFPADWPDSFYLEIFFVFCLIQNFYLFKVIFTHFTLFTCHFRLQIQRTWKVGIQNIM